MKLGFHLDNAAVPSPEAWHVLEITKPGIVVATGAAIHADVISRILAINPACEIFLRPYWPPQDNDAARAEHVRICAELTEPGRWEFIPEGQRHIQAWNEPNMPHTAPAGDPHDQWEGFGPEAYHQFNDWMVKTIQAVKANGTGWRIGFSPLTIGNRDAYFAGDPQNVPYYMHGPEAAKDNPSEAELYAAAINGPCRDSLLLADEYLAHIYTAPGLIDKPWSGLRFVQYAEFFPKYMPVWVTEGGCSGGASVGDWIELFDSFHEHGVAGFAIWILDNSINRNSACVQAMLAWQPPEPPIEPEPPIPPEPPAPEPPDQMMVEEVIRNEAWARGVGIAFNLTAAFPKFGRENRLGCPMTKEYDIEINGVAYRFQGFVGGIIFCVLGDWGNIKIVEW